MAKQVVDTLINGLPQGSLRVGTTFVVVCNKEGKNAIGVFDDEKHKTADEAYSSAVRVISIGRKKPMLLNFVTLNCESETPIDWGDEYGKKNSALSVADFDNQSLTFAVGECFRVVSSKRAVPTWSQTKKSWSVVGVKRADCKFAKLDDGFEIEGVKYTFDELEAEFDKQKAEQQKWLNKAK